jgi:hypothetical protein
MNTYRTANLPFAAYVHSTHKMHFLGCEHIGGTGRVAFVFSDPEGNGEQMNVEFEYGAECPAVGYYDSIRHLRRVMDRTRSNEQHEHSTHRR